MTRLVTVLLALGFAACSDGTVTATEPEPCHLVVVSSLTGDTTRISDYGGPPPSDLFQVAAWWWAGDCEGST